MLVGATIPRAAAQIELLAGDPAAAERELARFLRPARADRRYRPFRERSDAIWPTRSCFRNGRRSRPLIERASRWTLADDVDAQVGVRRVQARILAGAGEQVEAERIAR